MMTWKDKLSHLLLKAGVVNIESFLDESIRNYLRIYNNEIKDDPKRLLLILFEIFGPKILENENIRQCLLSIYSKKELRDLAQQLKIYSTDTPQRIVRDIVSRGWNWNSQFVESFCTFFGIRDLLDEYKKYFVETEVRKTGVVEIKSESDFFELHTFQSDVRDRVLHKFQIENAQKVLVQLPTGAGKTRVAMHTLIKWSIDSARNRKVILWLAYEPLLLSQAENTFLKLWPTLGRGKARIVRMYEGLSGNFEKKGNFEICFGGVQSFANKLKKDRVLVDFLRKNVAIIVFDETHKVVASVAKKVVNDLVYNNHDVKLLGLTATPGRNFFDAAQNRRFRDFFDANVKIKTPLPDVFVGDVKNYAIEERSEIRYLQDLGILAKLEHRLLNYNATKHSIKPCAIEGECYKPTALKRLADDSKRNELIIKTVEDFVAQRKKVLLFSCTKTHAESLCFILKARGIAAGLVLSENREMREYYINKFRHTNEIYVLINYAVLTTGFDAPEVDVVLIARPTSSLVTYSQMLGRGLRGTLNGGHNTNIIVNVSDPIFGEENEAYRKFDIYWR